MLFLGSLLKKGIKLAQVIEQESKSPYELQKKQLKKLLKKAKNTQFGTKYEFEKMLEEWNSKSFYSKFSAKVPLYNYNKIYEEWWHKSREGEKDVCWPGQVKYFALSSGTSEAASKHIPLTNSLIKANKKTSIRQILSLKNYNLPDKLFDKGMLMLGGSTRLNKIGHYYEGDLSGIQVSKIPFWFHLFYKPGKKIAMERDWDTKLNEIASQAPNWDIGYVVGVPAWIQIMMEKIIEKHGVNNIHEVWPNLEVYCHGGVSFDPYRKGFEKLLGRPITYIETYLASEGFIAFQDKPNKRSMKLVLNNGIFMEFVPFNEDNFNSDGEMIANPQTLMINQIEEGVDYALLISTCAGTWRYLIGDVIRFTSKEESEIIITGRTKHFLSLCGEHLSVDNMNRAIEMVSDMFNISIKEFTVAGIPHDTLFAHKWYIGTDDQVDANKLKVAIDEKLKELNDDYKVERSAALKQVMVEVLPTEAFYAWMHKKGKMGGSHKFPRVLKKSLYEEWEDFVNKGVF